MRERGKDVANAPWQAPRPVVLTRASGEEAVLQGCKGAAGFDHVLDHVEGCLDDSSPCMTLCSDISSS